MSFFKKTITKLKRFGRQISPTQDNWKIWCYHQLKRGYEKQELETQLAQAGLQKQLNDNSTYLDELYKNNPPKTWKEFIKPKDGWKKFSWDVLFGIIFWLAVAIPLVSFIYILIYILTNYTVYVVFALLVILVGDSMGLGSVAWFGACTLGLFSLFNRYED